MAGGIDWFRWHHGSVTDPKFALVARRAGASLPDVLAVWAYLLEKASAATDRGDFGEIDAEALDCLFNFPNTETRTASIISAMRDRQLIEGVRVVAWEKRQPKREREGDTSTDRVRAFRAKQGNETPRNAKAGQETPRGEERREEQPPPAAQESPAPKQRRKPQPKTPIPDDFGVSERVIRWAASKGFGQLDLHLEAFQRKCKAKDYRNASWDDAFMEAIREDWAKLRSRAANGAATAASFRERDAQTAAARVAEFSPSAAAKPARNQPDYIDAEFKLVS